jgi:serine O-acetyltransferase
VNIGSTNGSKAPKLGNNVFIGTGAKIIGDITIADNVAIGANAVVVKSITEPGTTWGGIPAKKISDHDSRSNMPYITYN